MRKLAVGAAIFAAMGTALAHADTMVGGWSVSDKPDRNVCSAAREYKDENDGNKVNAVALVLTKGEGGSTTLVISLVYEGWEWDKGDKPTADLRIDDKTLFRKAVWQAPDKTGLTGTFTGADALIDALGSGSNLYLIFDKDSEADFRIPNAGMALGAAKLCLGR